MKTSPALKRRRIIQFGMGSILIFLLFTLIAMIAYPGGTRNDPTTEGYQFFFNYFSDLGLSQTYAGGPKWGSMILFSTALGLGGISFLLFFAVIPSWFNASKKTKVLAWIGSIGGIICGLGLIVVALTPANLLLDPHVAAVKIAMVGFLFASVFYSLAIFFRKDYPNLYVAVYGVFTLILLYYLWLLFLGPSPKTASGLMQHCAGQKLLVYSMSITVLIQSWGLLKIPENAVVTNNN